MDGAKESEQIDGKNAGIISANFAKFLVDAEGKVKHFFKPSLSPLSFEATIKEMIEL